MASARRTIVRLAQVALTAIVLVYAGRALAGQWSEVAPLLESLDPSWTLVAGATVLVLADYAVLIQVWRAMLQSWGDQLPFLDAARIWFVSNLGRYVPGKVWAIGAMGVMAQRRGVSGVGAVGSSLVINLVNIVTGAALVLMTGGEVITLATGNAVVGRWIAIAFIAAGLAALVALPKLVPYAARLASRALGRPLAVPAVPARALWLAAAGTLVAWVLYGIAFELLSRAIIPTATGATLKYLAVFTGSYLAGYLALFAPGGLGVRELVLVAAMQQYGLTTTAQATVIAVASRLWLTILEIVPGLVFLPGASGHSTLPTVADDARS